MKGIFFPLVIIAQLFGAVAQLPNTLSASDKVFGLSKFWQEVNYNFVYLDKIDRNGFDSTYRELITQVQQTTNDYQYYLLLQKFCALLKDGHTNVFFPKSIMLMNTMFGDYRLFLKNIDGKAIVIRVNASKKNEIPPGSEVIEVNGKTTEAYIKEYVSPYISSSTEYVIQDWSVDRLLQGLQGDKYHVKIKKPGGQIIVLDLIHQTTKEEAVFPPYDEQKLFEFKWVDPQTAYLALNSFGDPKIDALFIEKLPELYKAKALIIDLRNNGGGNTNIGTEILQYLTNDKLLYGAASSSRQHIPTFKAWGKFSKPADTLNDPFAAKALLSYQDKYYYLFDYTPDTVKLNAKRIIVPTVLLLGHKTASAAEDFLIYADNQKHMIKMGENSFGSTGQPYMFELPGGGSARVCTKKDTYPDGREFVGYGIKPDIEVIPTVKDYLENRDPVMEKAIEYLRKKKN